MIIPIAPLQKGEVPHHSSGGIGRHDTGGIQSHRYSNSASKRVTMGYMHIKAVPTSSALDFDTRKITSVWLSRGRNAASY